MQKRVLIISEFLVKAGVEKNHFKNITTLAKKDIWLGVKDLAAFDTGTESTGPRSMAWNTFNTFWKRQTKFSCGSRVRKIAIISRRNNQKK